LSKGFGVFCFFRTAGKQSKQRGGNKVSAKRRKKELNEAAERRIEKDASKEAGERERTHSARCYRPSSTLHLVHYSSEEPNQVQTCSFGSLQTRRPPAWVLEPGRIETWVSISDLQKLSSILALLEWWWTFEVSEVGSLEVRERRWDLVKLIYETEASWFGWVVDRWECYEGRRKRKWIDRGFLLYW